jgi:NADH:ubiquinone oxidoreductase subunit 6 (subunit J)
MKLLSILTRLGIVFLGVVLLQAISGSSVWDGDASVPTTESMAEMILVDWAIGLLVLGALLAMAMVGAAYLVRDERKVNLLWELEEGGES